MYYTSRSFSFGENQKEGKGCDVDTRQTLKSAFETNSSLNRALDVIKKLRCLKSQIDQNMSNLPKSTRKYLGKESPEWDASIARETSAKVEHLMERAEPFEISRPPRQPVSLRIDPFDLALLKRLARQKGLPHTQLMAMWLHERIELEKREEGG